MIDYKQVGQRILDEHDKHPYLEWWDIAAKKVIKMIEEDHK